MNRIYSLIAVIALTFSLTGFVQAQGYTVNQNWLHGNANQVTNVNQSAEPTPTAQKNNLHIYKQRKGQPPVVTQTNIHGHNNTVANYTPHVVHHGPVFGPKATPNKKLVNLRAMQYSNPPTPAPHRVCHGGANGPNPFVGKHHAVTNAVQNALANSLGGFGQGPMVNVNITINTIIGDNNQILNQIQ